ncbi:MAG TPA: hypothetical protein PLP25_10605, partial [Candidatus Limiplasma sp.]|nr:hypothetical protein [Candidatus Limiplasma sp.]
IMLHPPIRKLEPRRISGGDALFGTPERLPPVSVARKGESEKNRALKLYNYTVACIVTDIRYRVKPVWAGSIRRL